MVMSLNELKKNVNPILRKSGVKKAGIFGSYVRDEAREDSDLDILVEIEDNISLLDFAGIKVELEDKLGISVDLVEYKTLKPQLRKSILEDEVVIL